jgi:hypothetical protein
MLARVREIERAKSTGWDSDEDEPLQEPVAVQSFEAMPEPDEELQYEEAYGTGDPEVDVCDEENDGEQVPEDDGTWEENDDEAET